MFMIRGAGIEEVEECTDALVTYEKREDAIEVLGVAKALAEQTGIPIATITPTLKQISGFSQEPRSQ